MVFSEHDKYPPLVRYYHLSYPYTERLNINGYSPIYLRLNVSSPHHFPRDNKDKVFNLDLYTILSMKTINSNIYIDEAIIPRNEYSSTFRKPYYDLNNQNYKYSTRLISVQLNFSQFFLFSVEKILVVQKKPFTIPRNINLPNQTT